ncbi:family 43 glycosylhydrolase [Pedobacter sp. SD-b]|uniref:Family 43 glycosylhydrolase n=1 Tax=Pedobacter segetis TaxID=2793069 RepID=A0ABS1BGG0_9SPHI|nr:family 43 glycosylhydrolase [Pedobacter segetis]MBK0381932.1 family 43 glycosylhydrolase [Pedobacter segetis]
MRKIRVWGLLLGLFTSIVSLQLSCKTKSSSAVLNRNLNQDSVAPLQTKIYPDRLWRDTNGNPINAHSAGIYYEKGYYYWYGEHKLERTSETKGHTDGGMHAYRSKDLINWEDLGLVLSVDYKNKNADMAYGCIFQRPKVVYNAKTKKYVAFFKLYLKGVGYGVCHTGVATADHPQGPFTYSHKFLASSQNGSGDFALYQDEKGNLYHFTVRKSDRVFVKARMTDDYMNPATEYLPCKGVTVSTEGPAIFYSSGTYHLLGSGSTGWNPNPARYFTSKSLEGPWVNEGNPCSGINPISNLGPEKTYDGQSTFIVKIEGKSNQYIALFDVWKPKDIYNSKYIWLPFKLKNDKMQISWIDSWNMDWYHKN